MASIAPFVFYCQKVLPAVYDDSLSFYENVCKMVAKLNEVIEYANLSGPAMEDIQRQIDELKQQLDDFKEHGFDEYYKEQVVQWINDNLQYIMETVIRQVYFGLNLEGYFVAYVPESWSDIVFDTGAVYNLDTYGRLILRWDADSPETVNQTREVVR